MIGVNTLKKVMTSFVEGTIGSLAELEWRMCFNRNRSNKTLSPTFDSTRVVLSQLSTVRAGTSNPRRQAVPSLNSRDD